MNSFTSWDAELYHHGIKGQKWGIRRFQNEDGTLTDEGLRRYGEGTERRLLQRSVNRNLKASRRSVLKTAIAQARAERYSGDEKYSKKQKAKAESYAKVANKYVGKADESFRAAKKKGYETNQKERIFLVSTTRGRDYAKSAIKGGALGALAGAAIASRKATNGKELAAAALSGAIGGALVRSSMAYYGGLSGVSMPSTVKVGKKKGG